MHIDDGQRISVHITHDVMGSSHLCCTQGGILGVMVPSFSFVRSSSLFALVTVISCFLLPSSGLLFLRLVSEYGKFGSTSKGVSVYDCGVVIIVSSGLLMICTNLTLGPRWMRGGRDSPSWLLFEACRGVCRLKRNLE